MRVVFVSNILNHHQRSFSENMMQHIKFEFVATSEQSSVGYQLAEDADYVHHWYRENEKQEIIELIKDSDVVIFGSQPKELFDIRMSDSKLTFKYCERFFKKGIWRRFIPITKKNLNNTILNYKNNNLYVLCASAYLPYDLDLLGFPIEKCYKWGYFPEFKKYENINKIIDNKIPFSILWVGRFIDWKHPDYAIKIADKLKANGYDFKLNIIGGGILEEKLRNLIKNYKLDDYVQILGSMKPEQVRSYMEKSEIFLCTSDRNEGWGAVVNEAMNSACAVIASNAVGSVPFLIKYKHNGLIYQDGNLNDLYDKVKLLIEKESERKRISLNAYNTIYNEWNPENASKRLIKLINDLLNENNSDRYKDGPCSKAYVLKDGWKPF